MAAPKRRTSLRKRRMRIHSHKKKLIKTNECDHCGAAHEPHRACPSCGYYKKRHVLTINVED